MARILLNRNECKSFICAQSVLPDGEAFNDPGSPHSNVRIECRNGRFMLTDHSANGTYIAADGGAMTYVHRDSYVLTGSGTLVLGDAAKPGAAARVRYQVA